MMSLSRAIVSQQKNWQMKSWLQTFLGWVCMFSLCMHEFSPETLVLYLRPKTRLKHVEIKISCAK